MKLCNEKICFSRKHHIIGPTLFLILLTHFADYAAGENINKTWDDPEVFGLIEVNTNIVNCVPLEVAAFAAQERARYKWGQVVLGPCIPCCNDCGELSEYIFIVERNSQKFSSYFDIKQSIQHGQSIIEKGESQLNRKDQEAIKEIIEKRKTVKKQNNYDLVPLPRSIPGRELAVRQYGQQLSIGADRFGAVIVSASYNAPAVRGALHHLPDFIVNLERLQSVASQKLGQSVGIHSVICRGPDGFVVKYSKGSRSICLDAHTEKQILPTRANPIADSDRKAKEDVVDHTWEPILSAMENQQ